MSVILPPAPKMCKQQEHPPVAASIPVSLVHLLKKRERTPEAVVPQTKTATAVHYCNREQGASSAFSTIFRRNITASEVRRAP